MVNTSFNYVLDWVPGTNSSTYNLWHFDHTKSELLPSPAAETGTWSDITQDHQLIPIGKYMLDWVPSTGDYRLWDFDAQKTNPLTSIVQQGTWTSIQTGHQLIPLGNYILDWEPETGKYNLWNFDPQSTDPLPKAVQTDTWHTVRTGHQLIPFGNYVLDWVPETGDYHLWTFDPQSTNPLPDPAVQKGNWSDIKAGHQLIPVGDYIIDWVPADKTYRLWHFDPQKSNPLTGPIQSGTWSSRDLNHTLVGIQTLIPIQVGASPGTMDYMRSKIKHVVYYMLENRSFDHVCGWLYENSEPKNLIGNSNRFDGAKPGYFNRDSNNQKIHISKYNGGQLTADLDCPTEGCNHDHADVMQQLFQGSDKSYVNRQSPPMTGFVLNNKTPQMMETYTPTQLPILNGLAKSYAVSDRWFCSLPGPTDVNRAFSLTGSSYGTVENFEGHDDYPDWPKSPHRPSLWNTLWSNGFSDWKIYYFDDWGGTYCGHHWGGDCYTYHLFLKNHIPTVDENQEQYVSKIAQFYKDAQHGTLPRFSYIEPAWVGNQDGTHTPNSYHPTDDLIPGEKALNDVYNALVNSPKWEETLLIITFDEHGGIYDHVSPPYGTRPYPHDKDEDFLFDLFGVRVPTILISPWIEENTVFRSTESVDYDATSFPATLLEWYGIPKEKWGHGERMAHAPTFESVVTKTTARSDKPHFTPPGDESHTRTENISINDLHRLFVPRTLHHIAQGKLNGQQLQQTADDMLSKANNIKELHTMLSEFKEKHGTH